MPERKTSSKADRREQAVCKVARERLHVELGMEHRESERTITMAELRRVLEDAYDLGVRSALS